MKKSIALLAVLLVASLGLAALAAEGHPAKKDPAGLARIKALAGEWEGKTS